MPRPGPRSRGHRSPRARRPPPERPSSAPQTPRTPQHRPAPTRPASARAAVRVNDMMPIWVAGAPTLRPAAAPRYDPRYNNVAPKELIRRPSTPNINVHNKVRSKGMLASSLSLSPTATRSPTATQPTTRAPSPPPPRDRSPQPAELVEWNRALLWTDGPLVPWDVRVGEQPTALEGDAEIVAIQPLAMPVCRDADDDWILATALAAKADGLVTGDNDLLVLGRHEGVPILTPRDCLALLRSI